MFFSPDIPIAIYFSLTQEVIQKGIKDDFDTADKKRHYHFRHRS